MMLSMMILLIITIMSVSMAKSFFLEEGMASNLREKTRSFNAAQAALTYGEWYITNHPGYGVACSTTGKQSNPVICTNAVTRNDISGSANVNLNSKTPFGTYFLSPTSSYLSVSASGGQDTFYAQPGVYIQFLGLDTSNADYIYLITAYGYGGTSNSVSIVQSTFVTLAGTRSLGGP